MVHFRTATKEDAKAIALLHAKSWQRHYRNMLPDEYLDNEVIEDRKDVWQQRMMQPDDNQYIILAEKESILCGFACTYAKHDEKWGALLDNLHVLSEYQGLGIGKQLIKNTADWLIEKQLDQQLYLWVLEQNLPAIGFYQRIGAICYPPVDQKSPDGGIVKAIRCVWPDLNILSSL